MITKVKLITTTGDYTYFATKLLIDGEELMLVDVSNNTHLHDMCTVLEMRVTYIPKKKP